MADLEHSEITAENVHVPGYTQSTNPGAVGAGQVWVDTSSTPYLYKVRNSANTAWETIATPDERKNTHMAKGRPSSTQNFTNSGWTRVQYDNVQKDLTGTITTGSSWVWTAPFDCFVMASFKLGFSLGDQVYFYAYLNSTSTAIRQQLINQAGSWTSHNLSLCRMVDKDETLFVRGKKVGGGTATSVVSWSYFTIAWVEI